MKSVEQQLAEGLKALKFHCPAKFEETLAKAHDEAQYDLGRQLAIVNGALKESGQRIRKNNGADTHSPFLFDESDLGSGGYWTRADEGLSEADRVRQLAKDMRVSVREASIFLGLPDPGKDAKFSAELQETLKDKWAPMRGLLSESEIDALVAKGVAP
jgi:hypothetical protein